MNLTAVSEKINEYLKSNKEAKLFAGFEYIGSVSFSEKFHKMKGVPEGWLATINDTIEGAVAHVARFSGDKALNSLNAVSSYQNFCFDETSDGIKILSDEPNMMTFKELRLSILKYFETQTELICTNSDNSGYYATIKKAKVTSKGQKIDGWIEEDSEGTKTAFKNLRNAIVQALRDSFDERFEDEMFIEGEDWDQNTDKCFWFRQFPCKSNTAFALFKTIDFE